MAARGTLGTLMNDRERAQLLERLRRLRPDARPAWGTLDAPRMLCHVADQMRVGLGDLAAKPVHNLATRTLLRYLVVHTRLQAPRGKIQASPEMLITRPAAWEADLRACQELAERIGQGQARAVHPAFGPLSPEEWAKLSFKHTQHHLVQFGV